MVGQTDSSAGYLADFRMDIKDFRGSMKYLFSNILQKYKALMLLVAAGLLLLGFSVGWFVAHRITAQTQQANAGNEIVLEAQGVSASGVSDEEQTQIVAFTETFEQALQERNSEKTMSFFSPPETKGEQSELDSIAGADLARVGVSNPTTRLFTTQGRNFSVDAHYVRSVSRQGAQVRVIVDELRIIASGGEFVGYIAKVARLALILDKTSHGYNIAQYYFTDNANHHAAKYDGLTSL